MSSRHSPSSIPRPPSRPRITSDHFRPLPSDAPYTSAPSLTVNRKRPRAETAHYTQQDQEHPVVNSAPNETVTTPRTFSANFGQLQHEQAVQSHGTRTLSSAIPHADLQSLLTTNIGPPSPTNSTPSYLTSALAQSQQPASTWKIPLVGVAATVAGKVWDFVSNTTFLGFRAGGGTAYDMGCGNAEPLEASRSPGRSTTSASLGRAARQFSWGAPNIPGHFPRDEEPHTSQGAEEAEEAPPSRGAKRRQVSHNGDWVIVEPDTESSTPTPNSPPHSQIPRLSSPRASSIRRRSHLALPASSPRRVHSTAYTTVGSNSSSRRTSTFTHSLTTKPLRSARSFSSFPSSASTDVAVEASPRTPRSSRITAANTLTSADVAKFRAKKEREERLQDASMRKLNEQLRAMIKEGKAALGTRVDVDVEGEDD